MAGSADNRRIETGGIRGFADADLSLTHLRVAQRGELVGTLAKTENGVLAFQYADSWIEDGFVQRPSGKQGRSCEEPHVFARQCVRFVDVVAGVRPHEEFLHERRACRDGQRERGWHHAR